MAALFLQGAALALPSIIVPSPLKIFLISQSLANGWRATLPATMAPLITDGFIVVLALGLLSQLPVWYLDGLRIAGGVFLLYLAARTFRLVRSGKATLRADSRAARQSLLQALGINALNPNPYLLWGIVAGPTVLAAWHQRPAWGVAYILGFYLTFVLGLGVLVVVFGTAGRLDLRANQILNGVAGFMLLALGLFQIGAGLSSLVSTAP